MSSPNLWLKTEDAARALGLSVSTLHALKSSKVFIPGDHFYAAGKGRCGPLMWLVEDCRTALRERTRSLRQGAHPDSVETYEDLGRSQAWTGADQ
jgi:hypothetical protein